MRWRRLAFALLAACLAGCARAMTPLRPASSESATIDHVAWLLIVAAISVFTVVMIIMLVAALRRTLPAGPVDLSPRSTHWIVYGGAVVPGVILTALFLLSLGAMRAFPSAAARHTITYRVIGRQWWWDVEYLAPDGSVQFRTANELHVPVGSTVRVIVLSGDVIHSFWVPQMQGKIDLIPGDTNEVRFTATRAGVYRGQCAEYCGLQHAHMAFEVVAEDSLQWAAWVADQTRPAMAPADSFTAMGATLVTSGACSKCHTIRGTPADGMVGPDLTHVGSRRTLAAGALPNDMATMEAWIASAQRLKPGAFMPSMSQFTGNQLRAMAAYLRGLR